MKKHFTLKQEIPLDDRWDVIIVGGGPAGCTAAISAAREGVKTLLIEATGALGGMGTNGLVPAWCPFSDKERVIYGGLAQKIMESLKSTMPHVPKDAVDWVPIDPEQLKTLYDDMVTGSGASVLFDTMLSSVETDDKGLVTGIVVTNKSGLCAYQAKVYVDCTGDGDLAVGAGAGYEKGGDNGELQPASHCFMISNVDDYGYQCGPWLHGSNPDSPIHQIANSDKYPLIRDTHICSNFVGPGTVGFNAGHLWDVDSTDPINLSRALMEGRKLAREMRDGLAEYFPEAFANSYLSQTATLMGIRETRRIMGDYVITAEDYMARRSFEDEICRNSYYLDVHHSEKDAEKLVKGASFEEVVESKTCRYGKGESHGIPYRCLTPKGLINVLVAGRSISCDRDILGSVRVMPVCLAMGEAAGMAAAHAGHMPTVNVHEVDVQNLRKRLREEGAYLP